MESNDNNINLSSSFTREYLETDDSIIVKKIKSLKLLDDDEITFKNGYIYNKNKPQNCTLDNDDTRTFVYKMAYINKRDEITKNNTDDKQSIDFVLVPEGKTIRDIKIFDKYDDDLYDEEYILLHETFANNNMSIDGLGLYGENDIVLKSSYCNLLLDYPCYRESTVFTIYADDEMVGFTRGELALKAMQRFHLKLYLCNNYDVSKGMIVSDDLAKKRSRNQILFEPTMYMDEWDRNGLVSLDYKKETDQWNFICHDYI